MSDTAHAAKNAADWAGYATGHGDAPNCRLSDFRLNSRLLPFTTLPSLQQLERSAEGRFGTELGWSDPH